MNILINQYKDGVTVKTGNSWMIYGVYVQYKFYDQAIMNYKLTAVKLYDPFLFKIYNSRSPQTPT
jgi:hypothetical protein